MALKHSVVRPELLDVVKDFVCSEDGVYLRVDASVANLEDKSSILEPHVFQDDVLLADNSFWDCALPSYKANKSIPKHLAAETSQNVLYRKLVSAPEALSSVDENEQVVVFYQTSVLSFTDLLSHGSLRLSHTPPLQEASDATQSPVVGFSKELYLFNFNYDPASDGAKDKNMTIPVPGSLGVICEECYAYIKAGFELQLDIDLFQGIKNFKTRVYGDTSLRIKYTAKLITETDLRHQIMEGKFGTLNFNIGIIPVSISFSGQLDIQIDTTGSLSVRDDFSLSANAQLGTQYTDKWGNFRDISSISYPHHLPLNPVFEIDDEVTVQVTLIPTVKITFENCLPVELALKPSFKIGIESGGDHCHGASYNSSWNLDADFTLRKLHFMKWSVGAGVLPAHSSMSLVSERPLDCSFCSGCVNTVPILFTFDPYGSTHTYSSVRVQVSELYRECGNTDISEWLVFGTSTTTSAAYCSNSGYLENEWVTVSESSTNSMRVRMYNRRTVGNFWDRHPENTLEESWSVQLQPQNFPWSKQSKTGSGSTLRPFHIYSNWYPMIQLSDTYREYNTNPRFTVPYTGRYVSYYEVHFNVSSDATFYYNEGTNSWSDSVVHSFNIHAGQEYKLFSPISFYFDVYTTANMIAIPVYSLKPNQPLNINTIQMNGVLKLDTSGMITNSNEGIVVVNITSKAGDPLISVSYADFKYSTVKSDTIQLDMNAVSNYGWPIIQIRAPSNNQLMGLNVVAARLIHVPAEKQFQINEQAAVAVNATAEEVFVDTLSSFSAKFSGKLAVVESNDLSTKMITLADHVDVADPSSSKLLLLKFSSVPASANVHFIHRIFTGDPRVVNIPRSSSSIFSYHIPKSNLLTKFYFQTSGMVKIRFYDGARGLQGSREFENFHHTASAANLKTFEIRTQDLEGNKLYMEVLSSSQEAQVNILAVEVEDIDAREYQIKQIQIGAAGYRVFNISISSSFAQGLFLKCEPQDDSDPDLLASAQDLTTVDMTSKVSVMKTRLGKDQLGLSVEDSQGALKQGFFFLAVYSYNATTFMFDINALDAPRGSVKAAVGVEKDLKAIYASDIRQGKATLHLKLGGQFQFADSLYYDNTTKKTLAQSIKSTVQLPHGWNSKVLPRLAKLNADGIVMDKEQQSITVKLPKVPEYDPDDDEDLVLDTGKVLTPSFTTSFSGLKVKQDGSHPHHSDDSDHSSSQNSLASSSDHPDDSHHSFGSLSSLPSAMVLLVCLFLCVTF